MVKLFAAGFDDATTNIASYYIRVSAFSLYFMTLVNVYDFIIHWNISC